MTGEQYKSSSYLVNPSIRYFLLLILSVANVASSLKSPPTTTTTLSYLPLYDYPGIISQNSIYFHYMFDGTGT
jgi:hypothetical protein